MNNVTISFSLNPKTDADLARWLACQPPRRRSQAIREMLRVGMNGAGDDGLRRDIREIKRMLESGVVAASGESEAVGDEPEDVAAALDGLGL